MLLNEESGYFHQVPGWDLNCVVVGGVLAELSLRNRIDTDMDSLVLLDDTETGDPTLDPILEEIAAEPRQRNAWYWIERLAPRAESLVHLTLDRLVDLKVLEHHEGEFWTLTGFTWPTHLRPEEGESTEDGEHTEVDFIRTRLGKVIFKNEIPDPRDVIVICLINTCDIFQFIFELDEESEERIEVVCKMDLIGRSIAAAVSENLAGPALRRPALGKAVPNVPLRQILLNPHARSGNLPALFASLAERHGPVFRLSAPMGDPLDFSGIVLAGAATNHWVHRHGRSFLRSRDYFVDFEEVYGAAGLIAGLDGADHFRLRKVLGAGYSRKRLEGRLDDLCRHTREYMRSWAVGDSLPATKVCRNLINAALSPLSVGVDSSDIFDDLVEYVERIFNVHVVRIMPKMMLSTPGMKRRAVLVEEMLERVQSGHTPAQRMGCPRDVADELLSVHASDPQFLPETNLRFALTAPLLGSVYTGDALGVAVRTMVTQPMFYEMITEEADALFADGVPDGEDVTGPATDVTRRFIMECMRLYPIIPMSMRNVTNTCVVEDYVLPAGSRVYVAQTAGHYMSDVFPDPLTFDIDRYLPERGEHHSPGYAPYGVGTHKCSGHRWMELHLVVSLLLLAHHFRMEASPANGKLRFNPFPTISPSKKLKFTITGQRHELPV